MKREDLRKVTEDVCQAMLGLPLVETDEQQTFEASVVTSVSITGEWNATLEVAVCRNAAAEFAATMFATEPENTIEEEVFDAVSEVANMIGGNIKGSIGGECSLSLPCVGNRITQTADGVQSLTFEINDGWLQVFFSKDNTADTTVVNS